MSSVNLAKLFGYLRLSRPLLTHSSFRPAVQHGIFGPEAAVTPTLTSVRSYKMEFNIEWVRPPKVPSTDPAKSGDLQPLPEVDLSRLPLKFQQSRAIENADPIVKKTLSLEFAPYRKAVQVYRYDLLSEIRRHQLDTGSLESKITCLTVRIRALQKHLKSLKKDTSGKHTLKELIEQRYKYLTRLRKRDYRCFEWLLEQLQLTYKANPEVMNKVTRKVALRLLTERYCRTLREKRLEAYRKELDAKKIDFLKEKEQIVKWIEEEEKALNIKAIEQ
nr:EOG090X09BQ [Triops cancriformis]